ncbi:putative membrane protein [[Clostridium] bifermentans ATCC 638]|uniref:Putative membrane protein n=1 Tax=Paraclostridium bifermentans ATCC 638 = DSM 14991 TaxID=1233171 RepID=T4VG91_PARBF|nr:hypothetical protein [Paraclostridium bifermentans]EQK39781.1 putative membrane protein [[Clostridium] bifermentans ATCC 638] [Paraclostridium bifermentans ATCC 638 = DSM 14991]
MVFKLCYLFTFVLSITNILGATDLAWKVVFAPSVVAMALNLIVIIVALIMALIANR